MKRFALSAIFGITLLPLHAQNFVERMTNASNVRMTVTNAGTFGNAFRGYKDGTGNPSGEYPAGSGTEHLFESGIWDWRHRW